jgi:hypothetical protein
VARDGRFYLSGKSSTSRGLSEGDLGGKEADLVMPGVLVQLVFDNDRVLTY